MSIAPRAALAVPAADDTGSHHHRPLLGTKTEIEQVGMDRFSPLALNDRNIPGFCGRGFPECPGPLGRPQRSWIDMRNDRNVLFQSAAVKGGRCGDPDVLIPAAAEGYGPGKFTRAPRRVLRIGADDHPVVMVAGRICHRVARAFPELPSCDQSVIASRCRAGHRDAEQGAHQTQRQQTREGAAMAVFHEFDISGNG